MPSSVAPRAVEPSLPSFLHSVQCRITSDTLCLSIGGFRPFVSEVITAWPQSTHSSFWCLFLLCLPAGLVPLLPFIPCVFLMLGSFALTVEHLLQAFFGFKTTRSIQNQPEANKMNFSWQQNSAHSLVTLTWCSQGHSCHRQWGVLPFSRVLLCLQRPRIRHFTSGFWVPHKGILTHCGNPD